MTTVIIIPVLNRPQNAQRVYDSIEAATPEPHRTIFVGTEGDVAELRAVRNTGAELLVLPGRRLRGDYARKVNFAYRETTEPFLFLAADDLAFHPGWLTAALNKLRGAIQVVGTNDLGNKRVTDGDHSTHTLVTRDYCDVFGTIDEPGMVLHEGYNHWYVDDEFIQTAKRRNVFTPCLESHVEHLHYAWKKSGNDKTYRLGYKEHTRDRHKFAVRAPMFWPEYSDPPKQPPKPDPTTGILRAVIGEP